MQGISNKLLAIFLAVLLTIFFFDVKPVFAKANIKQKTLIHYVNPGKPVTPTGCTVTFNDQVNDFFNLDWTMPTSGMTYYINYNTKTAGITNNQIDSAVTNAYGAWSNADPDQIFNYGGKTTVKNIQYDGVNAIFWKPMSPDIIAQASVMIDGTTHQVIEIDTAFNKNFKWSVNSPTLGDCGGNQASYDLQNIATHEFGHWVGLGDLYNDIDKDLTMYGYGTRSELKKDSLGLGDITGVLAIAP